MKNILLLIIAVSVYFHFFPNEKVTSFFDEQQSSFLAMFSKFGDTKVRLKPQKIYQDMANKLEHFSDEEVKHFKEITSSRENVKSFYSTICKTKKRDIIFHYKNEQKVCDTIGRYVSLL